MKKILILLIISTFILASCGANGGSTTGVGKTAATVYKTNSCGCCGIFSQYLDKNYDVEVVSQSDISYVKGKYSIPQNLQSCHTTVIGEYFIEGHIPVEAIDKLMEEKPDIAGIAMPGMPSGSPGMPGRKIGNFVITAVNHDGSTYEFMRI